MTTNNKNNSVDAEIQRKLDAIKAKSKNDAKRMGGNLTAERNKVDV